MANNSTSLSRKALLTIAAAAASAATLDAKRTMAAEPLAYRTPGPSQWPIIDNASDAISRISELHNIVNPAARKRPYDPSGPTVCTWRHVSERLIEVAAELNRAMDAHPGKFHDVSHPNCPTH